jgi:hypothetical protein
MTLFIAELGRHDYFPRLNWRLLGTRWTPGQAGTLGPLMGRAVTHALSEGVPVPRTNVTRVP